MAGLRQITDRGEKMYTLGRQFTIGRDPGNDLVLDEPQVSRWHATIRQDDGGGYVVEDRLSTHGTYLQRGPTADPSRVTEPLALRTNDVVRVGRTRLVFDEMIHAEVAPAPHHAEPAGPVEEPRLEEATSGFSRTEVGRVLPIMLGAEPARAAPAGGAGAGGGELARLRARVDELEGRLARLEAQMRTLSDRTS